MIDLPPQTATVIDVSTPATDFTEAFLLGNGSLGAAVYGRVGVESFDLNLDTVWSGGPHSSSTERVPGIEELRTSIAEGNHAVSDELARRLQSEGWTQSYQPLARLEWKWADLTPDGHYRRQLDLSIAEARVNHAGVTMAAFVSAPDNVLVAESSRVVTEPQVSVASPHPLLRNDRYAIDGVNWVVVAGRAPTTVLPNYVDLPAPVRYGTEATGPGATATAGMGWAVVVAVQVAPDGRARLIASAESGFRGYDSPVSIDLDDLVARARVNVSAALAIPRDQLIERHRDDYRQYFDRVTLDLSPSRDRAADAAERYFNLGRYLLISSSRPATQATNLQGIWNVDVRPGWSSNYTTNINAQMNYWGAEIAGLGDLAEPLHTLVSDLADVGRATARRYYNSRGAAVHHNTDLWRFTDAVNGEPQWSNWSMGLAWLSAHLGERLDYRWSDDFALRVALPAVRAAAEFTLDQLVSDVSGDLLVSPSSSPEHRFSHRGVTASVTAGSTLDQELAYEVLARLNELADALRLSDALTASASDALQRLHLPGLDTEGRIEEWCPGYEPTELDHRHLSHLYGAFPGARITPTREPVEFEAVRTSLASRLDHGGGYTGWSQAWVLGLAARLGDHGLAQQALSRLLGDLSSASLLDLHPHPDWPGGNIFQIDGNLGAIAGIAELLMQSHDGAISLLPSLPPSWSNGSIRGLRARGDICVGLTWEHGELQSATLDVGTRCDLVLELPARSMPSVVDDRNSAIPLTRRECATGRDRWQWAATGGQYQVNLSGGGAI